MVDGAEAISAYTEAIYNGDIYDLVIMDLTIAGGMAGKEAAEKLLATESDAKLMVSSGYSADAEMARFSDFGFKSRLERPFTLGQLENVVAEFTR